MAGVVRVGPAIRWGLLAAVILGGGGWLVSERISGLMPEVSQPELTVTVAASSVVLTHGTGGQPSWSVSAASAAMDEGEADLRMMSPQLTYFTQDGRVMIRAARGTVNQESTELLLTSEVVGVYGAAALNADSLRYDGERLLTAEGAENPVSLLQGGLELVAPKLLVDVQEEVLTALDGVTLTLPGSLFGE